MLTKLEDANAFWATEDYLMSDVDGKLAIVNKRTGLVESEPETEYNGLMVMQWMQDTLTKIRGNPQKYYRMRVAEAKAAQQIEDEAMRALAEIGIDTDTITKLN